MDFFSIVGRCTNEQTKELAKLALDNLPDEDATDVVVEWAEANDWSEELGCALGVID